MNNNFRNGRKLEIYKKDCLVNDVGRKVLINTFGNKIDDQKVKTLHDWPGVVIEGPFEIELGLVYSKRFHTKTKMGISKKQGMVLTEPYWLVQLSNYNGNDIHLYSEGEITFLS